MSNTPQSSPRNLNLSDLNEIAALLAAQVELHSTAFEGSRVVFGFVDTNGSATQVLADHRNRRLVLPTLDVTEALRRAKDLTFSARREAGMY